MLISRFAMAAALAVALMMPPTLKSAPVWIDFGNYRSFADSPFYGNTLDTFYLEDFEDGLFNTPGVSGVSNTPGTALGVVHGAYTDSVDGDDGSIDGSGLAGHSLANLYNTTSENLGYTFTFDAAVLGGLPTHVGIVWTDGGKGISTVFEAFDANGASLGTIGPVQTGDYSWSGTTAEDHFFGVVYEAGISGFTIRDPGGRNNLEVDHLQYGLNTVPLPGAIGLFSSGLLLFGFSARKMREA